MILALDLGTNLGFASLKDDKISSGFIKLKNNKTGERFSDFFNFLNGFKDAEKIYYERVYRHLGTDAAHIYGAFQGILEMFCLKNNIELFFFGVSEIKKYIANKGNANKKEVMDSINKLGYNIKNDNEADALALLYLAAGLKNVNG